MIRVWGRLSSINVQKVVWCLDELGLGYERLDAGGAFGLVDGPGYRSLNPNGLVPTIELDDFVLWESNAIVRHLASTVDPGGIWPEDPHIRADADRWMDWQATAGSPAIRDAFWQLVRTPPEKRDAAMIETSLAAGERIAGILDARLADRAYVAGEAFTVGDIATGALMHRWLAMPIERQEHLNVRRWYEQLRARPGARQVLSLSLS